MQLQPPSTPKSPARARQASLRQPLVTRTPQKLYPAGMSVMSSPKGEVNFGLRTRPSSVTEKEQLEEMLSRLMQELWQQDVVIQLQNFQEHALNNIHGYLIQSLAGLQKAVQADVRNGMDQCAQAAMETKKELQAEFRSAIIELQSAATMMRSGRSTCERCNDLGKRMEESQSLQHNLAQEIKQHNADALQDFGANIERRLHDDLGQSVRQMQESMEEISRRTEGHQGLSNDLEKIHEAVKQLSGNERKKEDDKNMERVLKTVLKGMDDLKRQMNAGFTGDGESTGELQLPEQGSASVPASPASPMRFSSSGMMRQLSESNHLSSKSLDDIKDTLDHQTEKLKEILRRLNGTMVSHQAQEDSKKVQDKEKRQSDEDIKQIQNGLSGFEHAIGDIKDMMSADLKELKRGIVRLQESQAETAMREEGGFQQVAGDIQILSASVAEDMGNVKQNVAKLDFLKDSVAVLSTHLERSMKSQFAAMKDTQLNRRVLRSELELFIDEARAGFVGTVDRPSLLSDAEDTKSSVSVSYNTAPIYIERLLIVLAITELIFQLWSTFLEYDHTDRFLLMLVANVLPWLPNAVICFIFYKFNGEAMAEWLKNNMMHAAMIWALSVLRPDWLHLFGFYCEDFQEGPNCVERRLMDQHAARKTKALQKECDRLALALRDAYARHEKPEVPDGGGHEQISPPSQGSTGHHKADTAHHTRVLRKKKDETRHYAAPPPPNVVEFDVCECAPILPQRRFCEEAQHQMAPPEHAGEVVNRKSSRSSQILPNLFQTAETPTCMLCGLSPAQTDPKLVKQYKKFRSASAAAGMAYSDVPKILVVAWLSGWIDFPGYAIEDQPTTLEFFVRMVVLLCSALSILTMSLRMLKDACSGSKHPSASDDKGGDLTEESEVTTSDSSIGISWNASPANSKVKPDEYFCQLLTADDDPLYIYRIPAKAVRNGKYSCEFSGLSADCRYVVQLASSLRGISLSQPVRIPVRTKLAPKPRPALEVKILDLGPAWVQLSWSSTEPETDVHISIQLATGDEVRKEIARGTEHFVTGLAPSTTYAIEMRFLEPIEGEETSTVRLTTLGPDQERLPYDSLMAAIQKAQEDIPQAVQKDLTDFISVSQRALDTGVASVISEVQRTHLGNEAYVNVDFTQVFDNMHELKQLAKKLDVTSDLFQELSTIRSAGEQTVAFGSVLTRIQEELTRAESAREVLSGMIKANFADIVPLVSTGPQLMPELSQLRSTCEAIGKTEFAAILQEFKQIRDGGNSVVNVDFSNILSLVDRYGKELLNLQEHVHKHMVEKIDFSEVFKEFAKIHVGGEQAVKVDFGPLITMMQDDQSKTAPILGKLEEVAACVREDSSLQKQVQKVLENQEANAKVDFSEINRELRKMQTGGSSLVNVDFTPVNAVILEQKAELAKLREQLHSVGKVELIWREMVKMRGASERSEHQKIDFSPVLKEFKHFQVGAGESCVNVDFQAVLDELESQKVTVLKQLQQQQEQFTREHEQRQKKEAKEAMLQSLKGLCLYKDRGCNFTVDPQSQDQMASLRSHERCCSYRPDMVQLTGEDAKALGDATMSGDGHVTLTTKTKDKKGFLLLTKNISLSKRLRRIAVRFEYQMFGGPAKTPGEGFCLSFLNPEVPDALTVPGGMLGYDQKPGALFGIGFDVRGDFQIPKSPNCVVLKAGEGDAFKVIQSKPVDMTSTETNWRKVDMLLEVDILSHQMRLLYLYLGDAPVFKDIAISAQFDRTVALCFTASTSSFMNNHLIRNVTVECFLACRQAGKGCPCLVSLDDETVHECPLKEEKKSSSQQHN
eukprot:TRINITY_DN22474_c0_g1_i1.p1 TRINITY_DN22474_c0_g1~~TRINITY_DN22474_c0_g1_i1.p1  ORF type:complete len:1801 (+),score=372.05 TRINITY_DN22474_c0_g1_i1:27-5429(+)